MRNTRRVRTVGIYPATDNTGRSRLFHWLVAMKYRVRLQRTYEFEMELEAESKEEIMRLVLSSDHDTTEAHSTKIVSINEETSTVRDLFA